MGRAIVLEWDPQRALVVGGNVARGGRPSLTRAVGFELPVRDESDEPMTLAESLAEGLAAQKLGKGDATVIVERSGAEMRVIEVPPVPDEELPQIVRFQSSREFSSLTDEWLLDYVPLPPLANGQHRVLAAAISPQVVAQIRGCCDKAGLHLKRVMLRPFAVARLLRRSGRLFGNLLLVERLAETIELTIFADANVQLTRSFRVSAEASVEAIVAQTLGEIRRTLGSFRNQNRDGSIARSLLMVDAPLGEPLAEGLREAIGGDVERVDPWELFQGSASVGCSPPEHSERFAAVLGAFDDASPDPATEIDFINPSRPPAAPSNRTRNLLVVVAVVALLASVGALYWMESTRLAGQVAALQAETREMRKDDEGYRDRMAEVQLVDEWVQDRVDWTDELARLSDRLPLPDDVILEQLTLSVDDREHVATLGMRGRVSNSRQVAVIERNLRATDEGRDISGKNITPTSTGSYRATFDETLTIDLVRAKELRLQQYEAGLTGTEESPVPDGGIDPEAPTESDDEGAIVADTDEIADESEVTDEAAADDETTGTDEPVSDDASDEPAEDELPAETTEGDEVETSETEEDGAATVGAETEEAESEAGEPASGGAESGGADSNGDRDADGEAR